MLFTAPLLATLILAAAPPKVTLPGRVESASAVEHGPVHDAAGDGFTLSGGFFHFEGTGRVTASAIFSGTLENHGALRDALIDAGFAPVQNATAAGPRMWTWRNQTIVTATPGMALPVTLAVPVPAMLPTGVGGGYYEARWAVGERPHANDLPPGVPETMERYVSPASRTERLGFSIESAQVSLSSPGRPGNEATFKGRLRQHGTRKEARLRAGFLRGATAPASMRWYEQRTTTVPAPPAGRTRDFEIRMPVPPMLHVGLIRGAYTPAVEVVGEDEPAPLLPVSASDTYQADTGIKLAHWVFDFTHPGEAGNTAIFSGTVENSSDAPMDVAVRAGFEPAGNIVMGGQVLDKSHWPWAGETLLSRMAPGAKRGFRVEFSVPPKMDQYLRIPSYYPRIILRRPTR